MRLVKARTQQKVGDAPSISESERISFLGSNPFDSSVLQGVFELEEVAADTLLHILCHDYDQFYDSVPTATPSESLTGWWS